MLVLSESELAKYYQLQQVLRDVDVCVVAVIVAWWTKLQRTSWDLKDKLGIDLETIATSPNKVGSCNPPPPLCPLLIQLCMVSKMTAYGEQLGDDAMGVQGIRASLVGILTGGIWFRVILAPMETLNQLDAVVDSILPLSPTSPSKADSRNPPPPLSPLLIQLCMVSKMTVYGELLGDDAMGVQGSRASLVGVLAGGV